MSNIPSPNEAQRTFKGKEDNLNYDSFLNSSGIIQFFCELNISRREQKSANMRKIRCIFKSEMKAVDTWQRNEHLLDVQPYFLYTAPPHESFQALGRREPQQD